MIMQYLPTSYWGKVIADGRIYVPCGICLSAAIANIFFSSIIITILLLKTQLASNDPPWWSLWFRVGRGEGRVWGQCDANLPGPSIEWLLQLINQGHWAPGFQNNGIVLWIQTPPGTIKEQALFRSSCTFDWPLCYKRLEFTFVSLQDPREDILASTSSQACSA